MLHKYIHLIRDAFTGYADYLWQEITHPTWYSYFYWLIAISLAVWMLEVIIPWRKNQKPVRKDFWLDVFYMFFNFFIFSLVAYNAVSMVGVELFNDFLGLFGITNIVAVEIKGWPVPVQFLIMFLVGDFIQWNVHRMLHRVPWMWEFHKVHHSVKEMGFAAHLRFHWMETIFYKSALYIPLTMIGFGITDLFYLHLFNILIGHLNHANLNWDYGPLKYIFNNPRMHLWHHAKALPPDRPYGMNYGISLSLWDYIFGTSYLPHNKGDIELGFHRDESFPGRFTEQAVYPWRRSKPVREKNNGE